MNGRTLFTLICVLFIIGIFWMVFVAPEGETSKTSLALFESVEPVSEEPVVASGPAEPEEKEEPQPVNDEASDLSKEKEQETEESETEPVQEEPGEFPEEVEYTPKYGRVVFSHVKHAEDYEIDCASCHHEDMDGGMARCINCHEPPKETFHKNCMGCHKALKKEGKETGPVTCKQCHLKETPKPAAETAEKEEPPAEEETPPSMEKEEAEEKEPEPESAEPEPAEPPEAIEYTPKYGNVSFSHLMHMEDYEIDCAACHHEDMEGGMARCVDCHDSPKEVFHKKCMGCHKALKEEGKGTGPVKCRECHVK
jgi:hypothetical protein